MGAPPEAEPGILDAQLCDEQQVGASCCWLDVRAGSAGSCIPLWTLVACYVRVFESGIVRLPAPPTQAVKALALQGRNIFLTGCGGSGKSFWIKHMIAHWEREGKEVRGQQSIFSRSYHSMLAAMHGRLYGGLPLLPPSVDARLPPAKHLPGRPGRHDRLRGGADWRAHAALVPAAGAGHQGGCWAHGRGALLRLLPVSGRRLRACAGRAGKGLFSGCRPAGISVAFLFR